LWWSFILFKPIYVSYYICDICKQSLHLNNYIKYNKRYILTRGCDILSDMFIIVSTFGLLLSCIIHQSFIPSSPSFILSNPLFHPTHHLFFINPLFHPIHHLFSLILYSIQPIIYLFNPLFHTIHNLFFINSLFHSTHHLFFLILYSIQSIIYFLSILYSIQFIIYFSLILYSIQSIIYYSLILFHPIRPFFH